MTSIENVKGLGRIIRPTRLSRNDWLPEYDGDGWVSSPSMYRMLGGPAHTIQGRNERISPRERHWSEDIWAIMTVAGGGILASTLTRLFAENTVTTHFINTGPNFFLSEDGSVTDGTPHTTTRNYALIRVIQSDSNGQRTRLDIETIESQWHTAGRATQYPVWRVDLRTYESKLFDHNAYAYLEIYEPDLLPFENIRQTYTR